MAAKFTGSLSFGDSLTIKTKGFTITARVEQDDQMGEPWKEHDGHGVVSEWTTRSKRPGERVLCEDRGSYRYYDVQASLEIAKRDGWDAEPYKTGTAKERAARAVERDFQFLRDWCRDEWCWVGVVLSVSKGGIELDEYAASLWGIESSAGEYLTEVANELLGEAIKCGRACVASIAKANH
jgi:hypothetical protein